MGRSWVRDSVNRSGWCEQEVFSLGDQVGEVKVYILHRRVIKCIEGII